MGTWPEELVGRKGIPAQKQTVKRRGVQVKRQQGMPLEKTAKDCPELLPMSLSEGGNYDFSAVFAQMKEEIQAADLALVNQEVILGGAQLGVSGYPAFNAPYELGDALADTGFDVILHATNHALDKGKKGILNCLSFWQENYPDIAVLGIHDSQEAQQEIYVYEQQGIRIAILNYTYGRSEEHTSELQSQR